MREIARKLERDDNITWFSLSAENFESIHNHSAYAFIERWKGEASAERPAGTERTVNP